MGDIITQSLVSMNKFNLKFRISKMSTIKREYCEFENEMGQVTVLAVVLIYKYLIAKYI